MKNRLGFALLFLLGFVLGVVLIASEAKAQQTASDGDKASKAQPSASDSDQPSKQPANDTDQASKAAPADNSAPKPKDPQVLAGPWTIHSTIELGARGIGIHGNADKYRSDLNYQPGFRLFDADLFMKANDGEGPLFDTLLVNSFGWGDDPNRYLRVDAEKSTAYHFDANYRRFDYFNSLRNFALNQHISDTEYRQGDFNLTLLPKNPHIRFNLGYSLDRDSGPGVTTYDYQRDEYPILGPTRYASDDYRLGFDARAWVFDISFLQGWRFFKDDSIYFTDQFQAGNNKTNTSVLSSYSRNIPTRGTAPYTRFSLHTLIANRLDFTGRYIYNSANTNFTLFETATGVDGSGNNIKSDTFRALGSTHRPEGMGDIGATFRVNDHIRISDTFRVNNFRIDGANEVADALFRTKNSPFGEVPLLPVFTDVQGLRTTNYRRFFNLVEGDIDVNPKLTFHLGYRFTDRRVDRRSQDVNVLAPPPLEPDTDHFTNTTNTFIFGLRAKPVKMWSVYFDMEHGSTDNVFTRVAPYDYTNFRVRSILHPTKTIAINSSLVTKDNSNPTETPAGQSFGADINVRNFTTTVDWTPTERFFLNSGYTYQHLTSQADVIYFLANSVKVTGISRYFIRDNFAFVSVYYEFHPRVRFYGSYRFHHDGGQGDRVSNIPGGLLIGSYPFQMTSPEFKISVKLHDRVDWILGYQYFDFKEEFVNNQFYQAHLPYSSLRFYFGRRE